MSIPDDFKELLKTWSHAGWDTKLITSIGIAASVLSWTSLADQVFQMKLFMLQALEFYRMCTDLLLLPIRWAGWDVSQVTIDTIVMLTLLVIPKIKAVERINPYVDGPDTEEKIGSTRFFYNCAVLLILLVDLMFSHLLFLVLLLIVFLYAKTIYKLVKEYGFGQEHGCSQAEQRYRKYIGIQLTFYTLPPILVAILAAIAEGLSRPLPG